MKLLGFFSFLLSISSIFGYQWTTKNFTARLDHFTYTDNATFNLRYLINDSNVKDSKSPILFYTGNEGDIELFANNTGFMWRAAEELQAMLVFAEHRYYGQSMPFGKESYKDRQHLGYLTSEQALADFVDLLEEINPDRARPVIAFGGSYGGMLAAWMRLKYPHIVIGALAASAPVRQFKVQCDMFNQILTSVFRVALDKPTCVDNIQKLWPVLKNYTSSDGGRKFLNDEFKFCTPFNKTEDFDTFYDYLQDVFGNLAMANYPFEANFLAPLPSYPVREFCGQIDRDFDKNEDLLSAFNNALQVYTNYTGKTKCLDISSAYDTSMGDQGWNFQACTEMVMPMCSKGGKDDMFLPKKWDFKEFAEDCHKKFDVWPRENAANAEYGTDRWDTSNIIFSNGLLDPWSGGGLLKSQNDKITIVLIPEGAHHIDLREDNKNDPASVKETRKFYIKTFKAWLEWNRIEKNEV